MGLRGSIYSSGGDGGVVDCGGVYGSSEVGGEGERGIGFGGLGCWGSCFSDGCGIVWGGGGGCLCLFCRLTANLVGGASFLAGFIRLVVYGLYLGWFSMD